MDYLLITFIHICIVTIFNSLIISGYQDREKLRGVSILMFLVIIVIVLKYLFEYLGFSIYPNDYKYTWIMGLLIASIAGLTQYLSNKNFEESGKVFMLLLVFVTFIIGLHELVFYTFRYEYAREEAKCTNTIIFFSIFIKLNFSFEWSMRIVITLMRQ
jgi:hypothetical protein